MASRRIRMKTAMMKTTTIPMSGGTLGCLLTTLIPLPFVRVLLLSLFGSLLLPHAVHSASEVPTSTTEPSPPRTESVSPMRVGEKRILAKGSWSFADEEAYKEWLSIDPSTLSANPPKLRELIKQHRISATSREVTVYVSALNGFAGFVQIRGRAKDNSGLLLWTSAENLKLPQTS